MLLPIPPTCYGLPHIAGLVRADQQVQDHRESRKLCRSSSASDRFELDLSGLHWDEPRPNASGDLIGQRRYVFHEFELQDVNEETDSRAAVPNQPRDEFKMRHRSDYFRVVA
jgi:hypothetical protein